MTDSPSNGLGKLLPKAITSKRRRNKASSAADAASSNDDVVAAQKGGDPGNDARSDARSLSGSTTSAASRRSNHNNDSNENPDGSDSESSHRRPTAFSANQSQIDDPTTSSPLVQVTHNPEPLDSNTTSKQPERSSTVPNGSSDSLESAPSLGRGRSALEAPQLHPKRSASSSRLRDVFRSKKSSADEKSPAPGIQAEAEPKASVDRRRRLSRGQKLEPLRAPPRTPPGEPPTPVIVNTPPTPTDPEPGDGKLRRPPDAVLTGSMITQRRRAGSGAGPSKLSTVAAPPLTPTPENGPASPSNPASTFFSSMFSAVQNTASSLSTTIPSLTQGAGKNKGTPGKEVKAEDDPEAHSVEVESVAPQRPSTEPKEPAVKTLGMGDLSLSHLGIVEAPSAAPSPVATRFAETETRTRSESAPVDPHAAGIDLAEDIRPRSVYEAVGGERTPPAGSVYEGKTGIHRSGSIRSAIGHRRNRGSSIATHATTATSTIGAAIAAANASLVNPAATVGAPKLTGFAVANKKRNRDFHALFKSVPDDDYLIEDYSCALQREILAHGRLYVSEGHLCFSSNILGWVTTLVMSFDEIVSVEKRSTALVFKNGLEISTLHAKHIFASFASRDTTYDLIIKIWKLGHPHLQSSLNGVRLEEPGGDRTEKVDVESVSAVGSHSISGSDDEESDEGDDVYDEDEDEGESHAAGPPSDGLVAEVAEKAAPRKVSGAVAPPEKLDDGAPAGGADFPGPATHAPTDCGDAATHFEKVLGDEVIPAPLGKVYTLMFGPASAAWMGRWLTGDQKCTDLQMEDKRGLTEEVRTRTFSYVKPLNASIGPKQTKCIVTEQLEHIDLEKAVNVLVSTQNPDVPNGNIFVVKTKYCLTWAENNGTRIQVNNVIEWSGKSWIKGAIERGANEGQAQYCKDIFAALKAAVSSRARSGTLNGAAGGRGGKRRSRKNKSQLASHPTSDAEGAAKVSAEQGWGLFEPARPLLGPVVDAVRPILTGNVVYGILVGLLVASWFGFGARQPGVPRYTHDPVFASAPQRLAAYEEMWRREESDLWAWIEERVGLERLGADPALRKRAVDPRTVEERLRQERMDERELREAIHVTEEHLEVLKAVMDRKGAERDR
ncbi:a325132c-1275-4cb2-bdc7-821e2c6d5799 [Thermothielavioides terrestris]|uniref:VASt domain-containing protein n=2 Tax=Thermothielavioides terrestris TaxID=2587410 RepID=G2RDP6_THETT|nr:uncharacterized protein THITE_2122639 [Thermothielavioides terrestris NRRL 8126]AEO70831.1 hypothetical protein THITE_2122639 [Thermothielavioides terrestris NRRL 8126]SPQ25186.1 a325132c-1275-4cb2-bdc7-821e2c6d5799 [Thermothielavioides terrestris]